MTTPTPDPSADAEAVERHACPRCGSPAGSPCRTNNGTVAPSYHTARHVLVPSLRKGLAVRTPRDRRPGKPWEQLPELPPEQALAAPPDGAMIRVGYARCSTRGQTLDAQLEALAAAGCRRVFSEKVSTRQKTLPEREAAVAFAAELQEATGQRVALTVTALDRVGRDAAELMQFPPLLESRGLLFEMLGGILAGVYDPNGGGRLLFAVAAAMAEGVREGIREKTLDGLDSAARKGNHGGRPSVVTEDMLAIALHRRDVKGESVTEIARTLVQSTGRNAGKAVSRTALYEALKAYDEAAVDRALVEPVDGVELVLADQGEEHVPGQLGVPLAV